MMLYGFNEALNAANDDRMIAALRQIVCVAVLSQSRPLLQNRPQ